MKISSDVVAQDRALQKSQMALDRLRWEQCADPDGPQCTQSDYAEAVGVKQGAVSKSVKAWAEALVAANPEQPDYSPGINSREGRPPSPVVEKSKALKDPKPPTKEQHDAGRMKVRHGERAGAVVAAVAQAFGVTTTTAADSKPDWPARRKMIAGEATAMIEADPGKTWEDACIIAAVEVKERLDAQDKVARNRKRDTYDNDPSIKFDVAWAAVLLLMEKYPQHHQSWSDKITTDLMGLTLSSEGVGTA